MSDIPRRKTAEQLFLHGSHNPKPLIGDDLVARAVEVVQERTGCGVLTAKAAVQDVLDALGFEPESGRYITTETA